MRSHVVETVIVVWVRLRWMRVREGDVMPTEIVTQIARFLIHCFWLFLAVLVLWLPCWPVVARKGHLSVLGLFVRHMPHQILLRTILAYIEEVLDFFADEREFRLIDRLLPASEVIVAEDLNLIIFLVLCKHRIDKKNG